MNRKIKGMRKEKQLTMTASQAMTAIMVDGNQNVENQQRIKISVARNESEIKVMRNEK